MCYSIFSSHEKSNQSCSGNVLTNKKTVYINIFRLHTTITIITELRNRNDFTELLVLRFINAIPRVIPFSHIERKFWMFRILKTISTNK